MEAREHRHGRAVGEKSREGCSSSSGDEPEIDQIGFILARRPGSRGHSGRESPYVNSARRPPQQTTRRGLPLAAHGPAPGVAGASRIQVVGRSAGNPPEARVGSRLIGPVPLATIRSIAPISPSTGPAARDVAPLKRGLKRGLKGRARTVSLPLDETIVTETPSLYSCYGHIGEQVRVPFTGSRAKRTLPGAINIQGGDWQC